MEKYRLIDSDNSSILSNMSSEEPFDIRNYMNYDIIRKLLVENPTELALLEIACIMINNNIIKKYTTEEGEK
jgi:hypothetical protein|tara:strand:+ start:639 stop:854 length:216 start_codon:yes stop_codon:yes gene_type:complete